MAKFAPAQPQPPAEAARAAEQAAKGKLPTPDKPGDKAGAEKAAAAKPAERPRFEFYQILPGDKQAGDKDAPPPSAPRPPSTAGAKQGTATSPRPHSGETYWLQAGAFTEEREADNLRARIALTGLEASVRPVNVPDKGTLFRLVFGDTRACN